MGWGVCGGKKERSNLLDPHRDYEELLKLVTEATAEEVIEDDLGCSILDNSQTIRDIDEEEITTAKHRSKSSERSKLISGLTTQEMFNKHVELCTQYAREQMKHGYRMFLNLIIIVKC